MMRHFIAKRGSSAPFKLAMLVLLASFLSQAILLGTHRHLPAAARHGINGATLQWPEVGFSKPSHPCEICQALAIGGHYVPPRPFSLGAPVFVAWHSLDLANTPASTVRLTHHWQSRAPPAAA